MNTLRNRLNRKRQACKCNHFLQNTNTIPKQNPSHSHPAPLPQPPSSTFFQSPKNYSGATAIKLPLRLSAQSKGHEPSDRARVPCFEQLALVPGQLRCAQNQTPPRNTHLPAGRRQMQNRQQQNTAPTRKQPTQCHRGRQIRQPPPQDKPREQNPKGSHALPCATPPATGNKLPKHPQSNHNPKVLVNICSLKFTRSTSFDTKHPNHHSSSEHSRPKLH